MSAPSVSVVLPVYNDMDSVGDAIESVLAQTFDDYELVIVNDGSTDETAAVLDTYRDRRLVSVVEHESNQGLPAALNTGIETAEGEIIARQDSDDKSLPGRLQRQYEFLDTERGVDLVATGAEVIDEHGAVINSFSPPKWPAKTFDTANSIVHGSVMFRCDAVESIGGYDEFFKYCQDYDLWVRMASAGYTLRGLSAQLYQLRRDSTTPTVEDRSEYSLYALIARATDPDTKTHLKRLARREGLQTVLSAAAPSERAKHYRRLCRANIDAGRRDEALSMAVDAFKCTPLNRQSYQHLALAAAPRPAAQWLLSQIDGRR